jgi:hypothetical protein
MTYYANLYANGELGCAFTARELVERIANKRERVALVRITTKDGIRG